jgi:hypothetical protein
VSGARERRRKPIWFWSGALDDFLFYNRVLDDAEIRMLAAPP